MLTARTLDEARMYIAMLIAGDNPPPGQPKPSVADTRRVEGEDAWTLSHGDGDDRIDVTVPYLSEDAARRMGAHFGFGVSQLVDAGQWVTLASWYARRALAADMAAASAGASQDALDEVEHHWTMAAEALTEALKFLPEGAPEIPPEAFWSELGEQTRRDDPGRFTRDRLFDDLEYYTGTLQDFRTLHGRPS